MHQDIRVRGMRVILDKELYVSLSLFFFYHKYYRVLYFHFLSVMCYF